MQIMFDSDKDQINLSKHGVSLDRAGDLDIKAVRQDERHDYGETRFRAWGLLDGQYHCLAFTVREGVVRAISLRRAHNKEIKRHVPQNRI